MQDLAELKDRTRAVWSAGNYSEIARVIESASRDLVEACAVSAGQEVLDVAAGTGNFAILAAREGAGVVASDITPKMVEQGKARSRAEGVEIEWVEADVEELPFEDSRFDCVASVFGAMFAPRPDVAASELFRVARPGGTVGMASWVPDGFQGRMFAINSRYAPPPPGVPPAAEWGDREVVDRRFGGLAAAVETEVRQVRWEFDSRDGMRQWFEENAGPSVLARKFMPADAYESMVGEVMALVDELNERADGTVAFDNPYLLVVAHKRG